MSSQVSINRVLVIDDSESIHDDFRKILNVDSNSDIDKLDAEFFGQEFKPPASRSWEIQFATQGEEGYQLVKAAAEAGDSFSLAFVDMIMPPGWDGLTTIEHLWQVDPDLQIVVCTAFSDQRWDELMTRIGPTDKLLILKKPFDQVEAVQLATSLSEKRKLLDQSRQRVDQLEHLVEVRTANLQKTKDETERMLSAIQSMLIGFDCDGRINRWNDCAANVFGLDLSDALQKTLRELDVDWEDTETLESMVQKREMGRARREEVAFVDNEGNSRYLGFTAYPIYDDADWNGTLLLGTELTKQKSLESQLQQSQKLEAVGQLAAGVAHEINTPMQYIGDNISYLGSGFKKLEPLLEHIDALLDAARSTNPDLVEQLETNVQVPKLAKFRKQFPLAIKDASDGVSHVSRIVRAMKEFSHPGAQDKCAVDINHALETTITIARNEYKNVADLTTDLCENTPTVEGYAGELNQVFLNILVNASHAIAAKHKGTDDGPGSIRVATEADDQEVHISISDTGGGIPEEIKTRVFDPFFTTKEVGKGTGQGLHIAHSVITQKHGGRIEFETRPGEGTTFHIWLPRQSDREPQPETPGCPVAENQVNTNCPQHA